MQRRLEITVRHLIVVKRQECRSNRSTRQQDKFKILLDNYGTALDYATIATNSAGTALDKYENSYMKSAGASLEKFTAQFEQLSNTLWNSDFVIGAIDGGTGALGLLTQMVDTLGAIPVLAATAAGALSAFKGKEIVGLKAKEGTLSGKGFTNIFSESKTAKADAKVFERISASISKTLGPAGALGKEYSNLSIEGKKVAMETLRSKGSFEALTKSTKSMTIASKAATIGMQALKVAANMAVLFVVVKAIEAVVTAISDYINRVEKATEAAQKLRSEYDELVSSIQSMKDELTTVSARITELQGKGNLSLVEKSELDRLKETNSELERQLRIEEKLAIPKKEEAEKAAEDAIAIRTSVVPDNWKDQNEINHYRTKKVDIFDQVASQMSEIDAAESKKSDIQNKMAKLDANSGAYRKLSDTLGVTDKEIIKVSNSLGENVRFLSDNKDGLNETSDSYNRTIDALNSYDQWTSADLTSKFDSVFDDEAFENAKNKIMKLAKVEPISADTLYKDFPAFVAALGKVGISAEQAATQINSISDAANMASLDSAVGSTIDNIIDGISKAEGAFSTLGKALQEALDPDLDVSNESLSGLKENFGSFGKTYEDAIAIISNSKSSYGDVKGAIDSLASAYLSSAEFIKQVNDGNKEAMVLGLQNIGVTNAEEVAQRALANAEIESAIAKELETGNTGALTDSTMDLINATYGLAAGTTEAAKMLALWNLKKQLAANGNLQSYLEDDTSGFVALATAAGIAGKAVVRYGEIAARVASLRNIVSISGGSGGPSNALAAAEAELKNLGSEVEAEISGALNNPYKFNIDVKPTPSSTKNGTKEVEAYTAAINELYLKEKELAKIQRDRSALEQKMDLTDNLDEKIGYLGQINELYTEEQKKLHEINGLRDGMVQKNINKLEAKGFDVTYDKDANEFRVNNMEHLLTLKGKDQEATNALVKEYEELIKTTDEWNKTSQEESTRHMELAKSKKENLEQTRAFEHQKYTDKVGVHEDKLSLLGNQYEVADGKVDSRAAIDNLKLQKQEQLAIQEKAHAEAERLRKEDAVGNAEAIQDCIDTWWGAQNELDGINTKVVDSMLASYDDFISKADDFDWWSEMDTTKVEWLEKKLKEINQQYEDGLMTEARHKELAQETAKAIYDEKNAAIQETIDLTMELIKQEKQEEIDVLEGKKKLYADIINAKKESLALTKEEYGYQKTLTDKLAEISKIQNQLNELAPDDSREATAQKKQLAEELAKLQGDLDETQADHTYDSQVDALDKSQEAFEKEKDEEIKLVEESIDTTQELYDLAIKRIDAGWDDLYRDLCAYNRDYGDGISGEDSITSAWKTAKAAAEEYGDVVSALDGIKTENVPNSGGNGSVGGNPKNSPEVQRIVTQMEIRANSWKAEMSKEERQKLADANMKDKDALGKLGINAVRGADGVWYIDKVGGEELFEVYHDGGQIGKSKIKSDERIAKLQDGEVVVAKDKVATLYKTLDFAAFAQKILGISPSGGMGGISLAPVQSSLINPSKGIVAPNQTSFSPTIEVNINGPISKDTDPKVFGRIAGDSALEVLKTALFKGALGAASSPMLGT